MSWSPLLLDGHFVLAEVLPEQAVDDLGPFLALDARDQTELFVEVILQVDRPPEPESRPFGGPPPWRPDR